MVRARSVDFVLYFALRVILTTSVRRCGIQFHASCFILCVRGTGQQQEVAHDTYKVDDTMETKKFVNESVAFLTASHIAHYYFTLGYHVNTSAFTSCKEVDITIFTDDGLLPQLPEGFSFSHTETRELFEESLGKFFSHKFTFVF